MNDALRLRLDACFDDDVTTQAEAVPELVGIIEKLDRELEESREIARQCYQWVEGKLIHMQTGQLYHKVYPWLKT